MLYNIDWEMCCARMYRPLFYYNSMLGMSYVHIGKPCGVPSIIYSIILQIYRRNDKNCRHDDCAD